MNRYYRIAALLIIFSVIILSYLIFMGGKNIDSTINATTDEVRANTAKLHMLSRNDSLFLLILYEARKGDSISKKSDSIRMYMVKENNKLIKELLKKN